MITFWRVTGTHLCHWLSTLANRQRIKVKVTLIAIFQEGLHFIFKWLKVNRLWQKC